MAQCYRQFVKGGLSWCRHEAVKQKNENLAEEVELLKHIIQELEQMARGRGLTGILNFRHGNTEIGKAEKTA
ncbi:hypothetical protein JHK84_036756 [Glycine max]|nr:hypothetical protein JHK86_036534 [Glycine max]KAG5130359.1 hypothetical protein JHK84_036756 [Glycine max]